MRALLPASLLVWAAACAHASSVAVRVTGADGAGVADAVVFVEAASAHASTETFVMDQIDKEFVPHVLVVPVGARVHFPNKDDIHHHIYSFSTAKPFELPLYKGEPADPVVFDRPGVVKLGCNIHDWMSGIILVLPNPLFATTHSDGTATLEVPKSEGEGGEVALSVFHERLRGPVDATRKKVKLAPGSSASWKLELKPEKKKKRPAVDYK